MSKFVNKKIKVKTGTDNTPQAFQRNGIWIQVKTVMDLWKDTGTWWDGENEKTFYRLETVEGNLYELFVDNITKTWFLYKIYD